jgi:tetratricopeptide (TPR) repeat protein
MATVSELLAIALQHHQAGRLQEAEQGYRQILAVEPSRAEAWHLLSEIAFHTGRFDVAAECIAHGIRLCPDDADAHCNLGLALQKQGKIDEAITSYRRALQLQPKDAVTENNLGSALEQRGELALAVECYRRAIGINPTLAEAHSNLGAVLVRQGLFADAIRAFEQALELKASDPQIISNLSEALRRDGQILQAIERCRAALAIAPYCVSAHANLGIALRDLGRLAEANACLRRALGIDPQHPKSHFSLAFSFLLTGDFARGWREFEWRWRTGEAPERFFSKPRWNGEAVDGKTVLIWAEQGLGDTLQFVRYASMVKELGARVVFECQKTLVTLLGSVGGIDQLVGEGDALPAFDFHVPLLSLPEIFGTRLETIPAEVPYLFADEALLTKWRERLKGISGRRVGINWKGRTGPGLHKKRDIPLEMFEQLASVAGVKLISLQKEESKAGEAGTARPAKLEIEDLGELDTAHGAFMDTAAIMMNLDLVITSDTSVAHLAGALGVPVWVALPFVPDWRWLLDRSDSPWYPTMRLFRQKKLGDWAGVFEEIEAALRRRMKDEGQRMKDEG